MNQYDEHDEQNGTLFPDRDREEFDTGFEEEPLQDEFPERNDESDDHSAEQNPEGEERTEEAEAGTEPEENAVPSVPLPADAVPVSANELEKSGGAGRINAPEELAEELKELKKLNPQAAELALEDSPEGEGIRRRLAEYGAMAAQDRAESILDKRERSTRAQQLEAERRRQAIEEHNRHFQAVIRRDHPDFTALMSDPGRRAEASRMMNDIYAWIGAKPYAEAAPLMQIAKSGRDPEEVSALITRFKQERGRTAPRRPGPEGAYAVPGRGAAAAPSGDVGKDDFDAGFDM